MAWEWAYIKINQSRHDKSAPPKSVPALRNGAIAIRYKELGMFGCESWALEHVPSGVHVFTRQAWVSNLKDMQGVGDKLADHPEIKNSNMHVVRRAVAEILFDEGWITEKVRDSGPPSDLPESVTA